MPSEIADTTRVQHVEVDEERAGQRIDNFLLGQLKGLPKSRLYRILRKGEVRVNSKRVGPSYKLQAGDVLRIPPVRIAEIVAPVLSPKVSRSQLEQRIIYEDAGFLMIDKPSGLAVHGGSGQTGGLIESLRVLRPEARFLELVHRLDLETSGCVLVAKKRSALRILHEHFRENRVSKTYLALLSGRWSKDIELVDAPIQKTVGAQGERVIAVNAAGKQAKTRFRCLRRWQHFTLVECRPHTGRTHQIRVHSQYLGYPIAADQRYGQARINQQLAKSGLSRLFLHALDLSFPHPITGEVIKLETELSADLQNFLQQLDKESE